MAVAGQLNALWRAFFELLEARLGPEVGALGRRRERSRERAQKCQRGKGQQRLEAVNMWDRNHHACVESTRVDGIRAGYDGVHGPAATLASGSVTMRLYAAIAWLCATAAQAQAPAAPAPQAPEVRAQATVVLVPALVRNGQGELVFTLK